MSTTAQLPRTFLEAEQALAESLPGYSPRSSQQELATAIEQTMAGTPGTHLIGQGPTGTGKSLAYLIPSILSGRRVLVTTATKALQDQLAHKDLPFLAEHLGVDFSYAILKGRSNYICGRALTDVTTDECPDLTRIMDLYDAGAESSDEYGVGEQVSYKSWMAVSADADACNARKCKTDDGPEPACCAERARRRAAEANVVVVNHALFLIELKIRGSSGGYASMLGPHDIVVADEAHEIEQYAANAFGSRLNQQGIANLVSEARNFAQAGQDPVEEIIEAGSAMLGATTTLWDALKPGRIRQADLLELADEFVGLVNAAHDFAAAISGHGKRVVDQFSGDEAVKMQVRWSRVKRNANARATNTADVITDLSSEDSNTVMWVSEEQTKKGEAFLQINTAPIDVSGILRNLLFDPPPPEGDGESERPPAYAPNVILVSATILVNGSADYTSKRLGVDNYTICDVDSPFDYPTQARLYVPKTLPDPKNGAWEHLVVDEIRQLVVASGGGALVLFTSRAAMNRAYDRLQDLPFRVMRQGDAPNKVLAEQFMDDTDSVLLGLRSFGTGFDAKGDALRLLIIDKLPFAVPTEPVTEARCEKIENDGGSAFSEYVMPELTLTLLQWFGRLIRSVEDRGVVAILDSRLSTKGYGKKIRRALPDAGDVSDLDAVEDFFTMPTRGPCARDGGES